MKPRLLILLTVASVFLGTLPSDRAWGFPCDDLNPDCGGGGGGGPGPGGGGLCVGCDEYGDGKDHCYPCCYVDCGGPPDKPAPPLRPVESKPSPGEGQTPGGFFTSPDLSPKTTGTRTQERYGAGISFSCDTDGGPEACNDVGPGLAAQSNSPPREAPETMKKTEPVSDDGEFVVDMTHVTRPFFDNPFVLTLHYRSGSAIHTSLGYGWSHNYYQRLIESQGTTSGGPQGCKTDYPDVFYLARLGRTRFVFDAVNGPVVSYKMPQGLPLKLTKDLSNPACPGDPNNQCPWTLDDGSGTLLRFDVKGDLVSIVSPTGHRQDIVWSHPKRDLVLDKSYQYSETKVRWHEPSKEDPGFYYTVGYEAKSEEGEGHLNWEDPNGYVDRVTDSGKRTVYFVYAIPTVPVEVKSKRGEYVNDVWKTTTTVQVSYRPLQCLSLTPNDCSTPLVSFVMEDPAIVQEVTDRLDRGDPAHYEYRHIRYAAVDSFNLKQVKDANGNGPTYLYEHAYDNTPDGKYNLSENLAEFCLQAYGDSKLDCRHHDLCSVDRVSWVNSLFLLCANHKKDYCMSREWDGQLGDNFKRAGTACYGPGFTPWNPNDYQDWTLACVNDLWPKNGPPYFSPNQSLDLCRKDALNTCLANDGLVAAGKHAFGYYKDLRHNLIQINDGDGRMAIRNDFGTDPFKFDFDKVITHVQGGSNDATMTMEYTDLISVDGGNNEAYRSFKPIQICPESEPGVYGAAVEPGEPRVQEPMYRLVVHDIGGVTRTTYFDKSWRRLREIKEDGKRVDYNYAQNADNNLSPDGFLQGVMDEAGRRVCYQRDGMGRPLKVTELPSPKYASVPPVVTKMTYDDAGQLIEAVRDFGGPNPAGMKIIRDKYERVLAVGRAVNTVKTDWTCYRYGPPEQIVTDGNLPADGGELVVIDPNLQPPDGDNLNLVVNDPNLQPPDGDNLNLVVNDPNMEVFNPPLWVQHLPADLTFALSGCAANLKEPLYVAGATVDSFPSSITTPDGAIQSLADFGPSGPASILSDLHGPDPQPVYFKYDSMGRVYETGRGFTNAPLAGSSTQTLFDPAGQLKTTGGQDPNTGAWVPTTLDYDHSGNLTSQTGPLMERKVGVDELGHTQWIHEYRIKGDIPVPDRKTCFNNDIHGRLHDVVLPEGNVIHYDYDKTGRLTTVRRGTAAADLGAWAAPCNPPVDPNGGMETVESYNYGGIGLRASTVGGVGTTYVRDGFGRALITNVAHRTVEGFFLQDDQVEFNSIVRGYDSQGRVSWEAVYNQLQQGFSKPAGPSQTLESMTEYAYDALGRVIQVGRWKFANGVWDTDKVAYTKIAYDSSTNTVTTTDPEGKISVVQTDALGRVKKEVRAKGTQDEIVTSYQYDPGDKVTVTSTVPPTTQVLQHNSQGALKTLTIDGKVLLSQDYDSLGRLSSGRRQGLGLKTYEYDSFSQLARELQATDPNTKSVTTYAYNRNGAMAWVKDGAGKETHYYFDGLDRLSKITNGLGDTTYHYHPDTGRLKMTIDPAGTSKQYTYFLDGLLQSETIDNGPGLPTAGLTTKRFYDYTASGRIEKATLVGGGRDGKDVTVTMTHDSLGRKLTEYNDQLPLAVSRQYRPGQVTKTIIWGNPLENHLPVMEEITGYDNLYRTTAVQLKIPGDLPPSPVVRMGYQEGLLKTLTYGNQVSQATFSYNGRARPTGVEVKAGDKTIAKVSDWLGVDDVPRARVRTLGPLALKVDYYETDLGRRLTAENLAQPHREDLNFNGDATNEAVEAFMNKAQSYRAYTLDGASNWLSRTGTDPLTPGAPDDVNRYPTIDGNTLTYDKAGNLMKGPNETFSFDGLGHLVQANNDKGGVTYTYDPLGRRITENNGKVKNLFIWDGNEMIAYGPGENDANKFRLIVGGSNAHYALADQLGTGRAWYLHPGTDGSTLAVTNDQGQFAEGYSYNGYGEATVWDDKGQGAKVSIPTIDNRFLFQGQWFNPETGLHTMGLREYKAGLGRFIEKDPIGQAGGPNLYAFVDGQPLSLMDPSGMKGTEDKPGGDSGGGWQHYRYPSLGRELSDQAGKVFDATLKVLPGVRGILQWMGWASHQIGRGYRSYAGWVMEGETMESLSAGEDLALDLGEGLFTNGVMTGGPAAVGKGVGLLRGLGAAEAKASSVVVPRYEAFKAGEEQLMLNRVRAGLTEGEGIVSQTSELVSGQAGRGITYREQINRSLAPDGVPLKGEQTGLWAEGAYGPDESVAMNRMHGKIDGLTWMSQGRYKVTFLREWNPSNPISNPRGGIHSSLFDKPGEKYSFESGVGFLAPPGRGVVWDAAVIYDAETGQWWHYARGR